MGWVGVGKGWEDVLGQEGLDRMSERSGGFSGEIGRSNVY